MGKPMIVGAMVAGFAVGMLVGVATVWSGRFEAGRRYGYRQGCERAEDMTRMDRIRSLM